MLAWRVIQASNGSKLTLNGKLSVHTRESHHAR